MSNAKLKGINDRLDVVGEQVKQLGVTKTAAECHKELLEAMRDLKNDMQLIKGDVRGIKIKQQQFEERHGKAFEAVEKAALKTLRQQVELCKGLQMIKDGQNDLEEQIENLQGSCSAQGRLTRPTTRSNIDLVDVQKELQDRLNYLEAQQVIM